MMHVYSVNELWDGNKTELVTFHRTKRDALRAARSILRTDAEKWEAHARRMCSVEWMEHRCEFLPPSLLRVTTWQHKLYGRRKDDILLVLNGRNHRTLVMEAKPVAEAKAWEKRRAFVDRKWRVDGVYLSGCDTSLPPGGG